MIHDFPPSDANIFPEYILPAIANFVETDSQSDIKSELVLMTLAECLPSLAETSIRFLETSQLKHGVIPPSDPLLNLSDRRETRTYQF
jgi:phosphoinositide-3-kinase regulatory subunit 4